MRQVFSVSKPRRLPNWKQWKRLPSVLTTVERTILQTASLVLILSIGTFIGMTLFAHRVEIPAQGGEYTEALVGEPQLINPLYATTNDADQDLVALVYSGLLKWDAHDGLVPDLAESFNVNEEKTVYTFVIKEDAKFHNGDPVLARDVIFTLSAIQNPAYRSPLLPQFRDVSIVQEDDRTLSFILEKPNASFLDHLTVGILPSSAWADILPQNAPLAALNLQPVGSGPYQFAEYSKDKKGVIRSYTLEAFHEYVHGRPNIERMSFKFYPDARSAADALEHKFVEGASVIPFDAKEQTGQNRSVVLYSPLLSREVVLYFNQKANEQLKKPSVREAIAYAINKRTIVEETLSGAGQTITGPILAGAVGFHTELADREQDLEKTRTLLEEAGVLKKSVVSEQETEESKEESEENTEIEKVETMEKQTNQLTLTTIDSEEFVRVAQTIEQQLESVGLEIDVQRVPAQTLFEDVIRPRNFELLLTTLMFSADADPYVFWHSSQREGTGLNIADYQNAEVDTLLETARSATTNEAREQAYRTFQEKLLADIPAVFLYQSTYSYAIAKKIHLDPPERIRVPSDRFQQIHRWYIKTKKAFK